jgi:hypothetical protein
LLRYISFHLFSLDSTRKKQTQRLHLVMSVTTLKCEVCRLAASSRESNHKSLADSYQRAVGSRTVNDDMRVLCKVKHSSEEIVCVLV